MSTLLTRFNDSDALIEAGIDEAGRGCFWGPIMAGAVIWPFKENWTEEHHSLMPHIKDSKKITPKKRAILAEKIKQLSVAWNVGYVHAKDIDTHGITWANQQAFRRAIDGLSVKPDRIIIDGTLAIPDPPCEMHTIVDGDALYISIAAASILAKVMHDEWVTDYCSKNPECAENYALMNCKGYGTAKHRTGLQTYGSSEHHRQSFIWRYIGDGTPFVQTDVANYSSSKKNTKNTKNTKCLVQFN